jgi:hypothetical protein
MEFGVTGAARDQLGGTPLLCGKYAAIWRSSISRLRWRTVAMSILTKPVVVPNSEA